MLPTLRFPAVVTVTEPPVPLVLLVIMLLAWTELALIIRVPPETDRFALEVNIPAVLTMRLLAVIC
jgi:hypothetical protein